MFPKNDIIENATSDITVAHIMTSYNYSMKYYWHFHTNVGWQNEENSANGTELYLGGGFIDDTGNNYNIVDIFDEDGNKIPNLPIGKWYELRIYHNKNKKYNNGKYRSSLKYINKALELDKDNERLINNKNLIEKYINQS